MTHISTRAELYRHVAKTTSDVGIRDNINRGGTILWGRFAGGWVLETWPLYVGKPDPSRIVVGIKLDGTVGQNLISGRLSAVPWADYLGGESDLDKGDYPETALMRKKVEKRIK